MIDRVLGAHDGSFDYDTVDVMETFADGEYSGDKDSYSKGGILNWLLSLFGLGKSGWDKEDYDWEDWEDK